MAIRSHAWCATCVRRGAGFHGDRGDERLTAASTKGRGFLPDVVEAWEAELLPLRQRRPDLRVPLVRTAIVLGSTRLEPATTLASGFELRFASLAAALDDLLEPPRVDVWDPPRRFVDLQASGTHALWHHTHDFERLAVGTVMRDTVRYRPPAGWLGSVAGGRRVASWVDRIFDDRARKIEERFGA